MILQLLVDLVGEEEYYIHSGPGATLRRCDLSIVEMPHSDSGELIWEIKEMIFLCPSSSIIKISS